MPSIRSTEHSRLADVRILVSPGDLVCEAIQRRLKQSYVVRHDGPHVSIYRVHPGTPDSLVCSTASPTGRALRAGHWSQTAIAGFRSFRLRAPAHVFSAAVVAEPVVSQQRRPASVALKMEAACRGRVALGSNASSVLSQIPAF